MKRTERREERKKKDGEGRRGEVRREEEKRGREETTGGCGRRAAWLRGRTPFQLIPFASYADAHNFHHSHIMVRSSLPLLSAPPPTFSVVALPTSPYAPAGQLGCVV